MSTGRPLLRRATLVFLALPTVIFLGGFLRMPLAVAACAIVIAGGWRWWREAVRAPLRCGLDLPLGKALTWIVPPALVLTLLSGAGGWGSGDGDWLKHDAVLRDLLSRPWPVTYETGQGSVLLVYYVAFYLPAALAGKLAGGSWMVANQALALTTLAGTALSALWLVVLGTSVLRPNRCAALVAAAVFFGFSGLDVLGKALVNKFYGLPAFYGNWYDIEWWAQFAQYSSNAAALFWAPQHAFGGWLPLALVLEDWFSERELEGSVLLYLALAAFWSPFAAVGLLPMLGGLLLWRHGKPLSRQLRPWMTLPNAAGVVAGGFFALYLLAHFQSFPLPAEYTVKPGFLPMPLLETSRVPLPAVYVVFVGIEFAGLSLALAWSLAGRWDEEARSLRPVLALATGVLLVLPCFRYGYANDLVMRGSLPALFALQVLLVRMFASERGGLTRPALLAGLLLVGGLGNAGIEYNRHLVRISRQGSWRDARTWEPVPTLAHLARTVYARPGFDFTRQYLGSTNSFFARHLAARRGAVAPGMPPGVPDF